MNESAAESDFDPSTLLKRRREIRGMSAILLPFLADRGVDWDSFAAHVQRTVEAGLVPAINMDTGYANLIDPETKLQALEIARSTVGSSGKSKEFVAGAFVADSIDSSFDFDGYQQQFELIQGFGGTPIVFQSFGLIRGTDNEIIERYQRLATSCERFFAFELGQMFAPFGKIYSLDVFREIISIPECVGAKHSSLRRDLEWQRLSIRDHARSEFMILTGNDLAIDMVKYGSDYLLGLSTFCPDLFAKRDAMWATGDNNFYEINDVLQYLGYFAFRHPTSAYKHSAAMFLKQRGWIRTDLTHPDSPQRPASDRDVLFQIGCQLGIEMKM